jgi:hypothetical protein
MLIFMMVVSLGAAGSGAAAISARWPAASTGGLVVAVDSSVTPNVLEGGRGAIT